MKLIQNFLKSILIANLIANSFYAQLIINYSANLSPIPDGQINSIAFSDDGILWIGTNNGLACFTNDSWKLYTTSDGLASNKINSVKFLGSQENSLWVATESGLDKFLTDSINLVAKLEHIDKTSNGIVSDTLFSVALDSIGNEWIGTISGLSLLVDEYTINFTNNEGLANNRINVLNSESTSWIHAGTNGGGVSRLKYKEVDGITSASDITATWSGLASDTVLSIHVTDDTLRWYGTTHGVSTHFGDDTKQNWWIYNTEFSGLIDNYVRTIESDSQGNMWFGTKNGLSMLNLKDSTWVSFTENDGLVSNNIYDLEIDKQNNLWIATDKGISKLSDIPSKVINRPISNEYFLSLSAYPNPFNPSTKIEFDIELAGLVKLRIYNINGERVKTLLNEQLGKGKHIVSWNAQSERNISLPSGIYFIMLEMGKSRLTEKIILLK